MSSERRTRKRRRKPHYLASGAVSARGGDTKSQLIAIRTLNPTPSAKATGAPVLSRIARPANPPKNNDAAAMTLISRYLTRRQSLKRLGSTMSSHHTVVRTTVPRMRLISVILLLKDEERKPTRRREMRIQKLRHAPLQPHARADQSQSHKRRRVCPRRLPSIRRDTRRTRLPNRHRTSSE